MCTWSVPLTSSFLTLLTPPIHTLQLCVALNDVEQVRQGVQELPNYIKWSHFQTALAAETSPEEADRADKALKDILLDWDKIILQELTDLTGGIAEKVPADVCVCVRACVRVCALIGIWSWWVECTSSFTYCVAWMDSYRVIIFLLSFR